VFGALLAIPLGLALGLSPLSYPMVPAVVGCTAGEKTTAGRRAAVSAAFAGGVATVYVALGMVFGMLGLTLLALLNRSIWLWFAILAPFMWIMGLRMLGVFGFGVPFLSRPDPASGRGGLPGAFLLGVPFGLAGCPTCALILPSMLVAVAASGSPVVGALAMLGLGVGQGIVLVAAGTLVGGLAKLKRFAPYRVAVERSFGVVLLVVAAYFTWRALLWL